MAPGRAADHVQQRLRADFFRHPAQCTGPNSVQNAIDVRDACDHDDFRWCRHHLQFACYLDTVGVAEISIEGDNVGPERPRELERASGFGSSADDGYTVGCR